MCISLCFFFFQAEDGIRDFHVTGVKTCALPIWADEGTRDRAAAALREAVKPRRMALLTRFTSLSDGVKFLVDMRSQLLGSDDPALKTLDADLKELFQLWFDPGFLDIQRITWNSSASLLEKLMDYEANHSIISWRDLKTRLDGDRRCYTLFHPRMPQEP